MDMTLISPIIHLLLWSFNTTKAFQDGGNVLDSLVEIAQVDIFVRGMIARVFVADPDRYGGDAEFLAKRIHRAAARCKRIDDGIVPVDLNHRTDHGLRKRVFRWHPYADSVSRWYPFLHKNSGTDSCRKPSVLLQFPADHLSLPVAERPV